MRGTIDQEANPKTSGKIFMNSRRLWPCLWIGRLAPTEPHTVFAEDDDRHPFNSPFQPGEFCLMHPYQGSTCDYVILRGIFLPLSACKDPQLRGQFEQLRERYTDHPFASVYPDLDEVLHMRDALRAIGPMDLSEHFRQAGEAYFPFACTGPSYLWLAQHFEMVTAIEDDPRERGSYSSNRPARVGMPPSIHELAL